MADGTRTRDNRNHNPGLYQLSYVHHYRTVACPTGLEPVTPSLEGWCSIRMSYGHQEPKFETAAFGKAKPYGLGPRLGLECYLAEVRRVNLTHAGIPSEGIALLETPFIGQGLIGRPPGS